MEHSLISRVLISGLLLILILFVVNFVILPIKQLGVQGFLFQQAQGNFFVWKLTNRYIRQRGPKLSIEWLNKIEILTPTEADALVNSVAFDNEDTDVLNQLYYLDQSSRDVPCVTSNMKWPLTHESRDLYMARLGDSEAFEFSPSTQLDPTYTICKAIDYVHITTKSAKDTWIYLVSSQQYPKSYVIEFDFKPNITMKETLQFVFSFKSLADRFRFDLEDNSRLVFNMWKEGYSLRGYFPDKWNKQTSVKLSLPLKTFSRIKCLVHENEYVFMVNNQIIEAVRVKDFKSEPSPFALIFWNGLDGGSPLDIELKNMSVRY